MGRKSKRKHNLDPEDVAKADKKEITSLCSQLLESKYGLLIGSFGMGFNGKAM